MRPSLITEHFFNPHNVGEIEEAEAVGKAGSFTCGAAVQISLRIDESQRIADAQFKSAGCSYLVAASSFLTDMVRGKTTGEAAALGQSPETFIMERLWEWPSDRRHCAALACEVLVSAIKSYSNAIREDWSGDEALICTCFGVSERTIEREIQTRGLSTVAEVTKASNAGAGCRSCYPLIEEMLSQYARESELARLVSPPR